jgi:hypothetical protein
MIKARPESGREALGTPHRNVQSAAIVICGHLGHLLRVLDPKSLRLQRMHRSTPENFSPYPVTYMPFAYPDAVRWRHGKQDDLFLEVAFEQPINPRQYHDVRDEKRQDRPGRYALSWRLPIESNTGCTVQPCISSTALSGPNQPCLNGPYPGD